MDVINRRVAELINALGVSQAKFAERIGVSRSSITKIVNGNNPVTEHMKASILSIFGVNANWLETGEGEIFTVSDDLGAELGRIFAGNDERMKSVLLAFARLGPDEWAALEKLIDNLKK